MQGFGFRLAAAAFVAISLAGCTSGLGAKPEAIQPSFKLDGLYTFAEDGTGTRNGVKVDNLNKGETKWAFRTSCDQNGCVATGSPVDPKNPSKALPPTRVADYVDGKWSLVFLNGLTACPRDNGETFQSNQWIIWDIAQQPENKLSVNVSIAGANECNNVIEFAPSLMRIGDLPADTTLPDPADAPKRVPSYPANSFRGKYTVDYVIQANNELQSSEHMDVKTYCLRSEERCVTTTINVDPREPTKPYGVQVYEFAADKFQFLQTVGKKPCPPSDAGPANTQNPEGLFSKRVVLPLPPAPVPDPLTTLTGQLDVIVTGDCQGTAGYNATYTRTGD